MEFTWSQLWIPSFMLQVTPISRFFKFTERTWAKFASVFGEHLIYIRHSKKSRKCFRKGTFSIRQCKRFPKLPKHFSNIGIFPECNILGKKNPNLYSLPQTLSYHKNSKTPKNISSILEKLSQRNYPKRPIFWTAWEKPYVYQAAQTFCIIWKAHQCQWFNIRVKWIPLKWKKPSYYFIYLLYVEISEVINNEDSDYW